MRTTLTLEDELAVELQRRRRRNNTSLKEEVNALLRLGLLHADQPGAREPFETPSLDAGRCLIGQLDDVAAALAAAEGDAFP